MSEFLEKISNYAALEIFAINQVKVTIGGLLTICVVLILTMFIAAGARRGIRKALSRKKDFDPGRIETASKLSNYVIYSLGIVTALHMVGLDMSSLLAAGAVFGVAVGFAMQTILQNFVSGIILMVENSVHPGDILEIDDKLVRVEEIRIRSAIVRTLFDEELIVPNSQLVSSTVKNLTMTDKDYRLMITVGVHYRSDLEETKKVLEEAASAVSATTRVLLSGFGSSSVDFSVSIWITDAWDRASKKSLLMFSVWDALKKADIEIAFPQLDVHLDDHVVDRLAKAG